MQWIQRVSSSSNDSTELNCVTYECVVQFLFTRKNFRILLLRISWDLNHNKLLFNFSYFSAKPSHCYVTHTTNRTERLTRSSLDIETRPPPFGSQSRGTHAEHVIHQLSSCLLKSSYCWTKRSGLLHSRPCVCCGGFLSLGRRTYRSALRFSRLLVLWALGTHLAHVFSVSPTTPMICLKMFN